MDAGVPAVFLDIEFPQTLPFECSVKALNSTLVFFSPEEVPRCLLNRLSKTQILEHVRLNLLIKRTILLWFFTCRGLQITHRGLEKNTENES